MVRQTFDSERLTALRAELDKQTALLPAVLQSSDSTSLVDHLATVFNEADWKCTARCSGFVDNAAPSEPSGWEAFQEVLRGQPQQTQARSDIQAMDTALLRLQADIQSIEQTTCLPPSRLATLTASSSDGAGHLQAVRCTVCHSLLLAAAFNDHLPRCRPCIPQPAVPSNSSHPSSSGRQGSRLGSGRGRLAAKKGKGRGSKKPPAGPSRFAIEQAKPPPQQQPTPRPPSDLHHQLLAHPSQQQQRRLHQHQPMVHEAAAPVQVTDMFRPAHAVGLTCSSTVPGGEVPASQMQTAGQRHSSQAEAKREAAPQARQAKRSRSAWTYEEHLCRNNPDLDAVHDPMLPPRFPQNVTGKRSRKRSSPGKPSQPVCQSQLNILRPGVVQLQHTAAGTPADNAVPLLNSKQAGAPQKGNERSLPPHQPEANGTQSLWQQQPTHRQQQHSNGLQHQRLPDSQSGVSHPGTVNTWQGRVSQHRQQDRLLHDCPPSDPQHSDKRRRQHAQLPPLHQPAHSQQQDSQTMVAAHKRQQQPLLLQPAVQLPAGSFKGLAQHSKRGPASNHAKMFHQQILAKGSATNSLQEQGMRAAWPSAHDISCEGASHYIELTSSNGYRMPKSNRHVSVNALARSSLGV